MSDNLFDNSSNSSEYFSQNCRRYSEEEFRQVAACGYWVEGVAMIVLGIFALITNAISIYVFSR
jgi:uncharacterized membrane protein HdeD (DUF308 family)